MTSTTGWLMRHAVHATDALLDGPAIIHVGVLGPETTPRVGVVGGCMPLTLTASETEMMISALKAAIKDRGEIAEQFADAKSTLDVALQRVWLHTKMRATVERDAAIIDAIAAGASTSELGHIVGVTNSRITQIWKDHTGQPTRMKRKIDRPS